MKSLLLGLALIAATDSGALAYFAVTARPASACGIPGQ